MRDQRTTHLVNALIILVIACALSALVGCPDAEMGTLDQVTIVKHRYVIDESDDVVRVVGLARNTGELPSPEAEIVVTLRSRTGSFRGQNRVSLPELAAGGEEQFALAINSHGAVETMEFEIVEPGTVTGDDPEQTEGDTEEAESDGS